jgi:photosystem II stability/assembly factor-like uncharacterized protein
VRGLVLISNTAGSVWERWTPPEGEVPLLRACLWTPDLQVVACGEDGAYSLVVEGLDHIWEADEEGINGTCLAAAGRYYWMGGLGGEIWRGRGTDWRPRGSVPAPVKSLAFLSDTMGVCVAGSSGTERVYHTVDGAETWTADNLPAGFSPRSCALHPGKPHPFRVGGWLTGRGPAIAWTPNPLRLRLERLEVRP